MMYYRIIRNDIVKSKAITLTTILFVAAAAMLVALAAILVVNLTGAIDRLMLQAQTPHFMQMHAGELDSTRLEAFAAQRSEVSEYQVVEFLNVDGAQIRLDKGSLAGSVQDNGFSVQNEHFDFLLNLDGNIIQVSDGEIYVPIPYWQDGLVEVGDSVTVFDKEFTVAGILRDSQMNSLLSSSKRFLVSEKDYADLLMFGTVEYLIEFRLEDVSDLGAFAAAYAAAGLEANGPTITEPLFRMLNSLSDGLMIAVILLISALVVAVAFLCIRFTLLAKIEEDYREIGVMKAIGMRVNDIKKIYLAKYAVLAAAGSLAGFALSFLCRDELLANIRLYMGESENHSLAQLVAILGVCLVFLAIVAYVNGVLGGFRKIPAAEAIRFGLSQEKTRGGKKFHLSHTPLLGTNVFLGVKDVLTRKKIYVTMLAVLVLASFIIIVPQNLHNTISSKSFITYMGLGDSDMRIDIQQTDNIAEKALQIAEAMENDDAIASHVVLTTQAFRAKLDDGSEVSIKVELGDHAVFPLTYAEGRAPAVENEIALSVMNASEMKKKVGDVIPVMITGKETILTVSGIYSDVTNGGKTAKAVFSDPSADIMWSVISAELTDASLLEPTIASYADRFGYAKVSDIDEFIMQTYGTTIRSIGKAAMVAIIIALAISVLITLLFMRMLVVKDRHAIAVMKAFGFANADIQMQFIVRSVMILFIGIVLGILLANTLGETLVGAVIGSFGASSFAFVINPLRTYLIAPLLMGLAVLTATMLGTMGAGNIKLSDHIKE